MSETFNPHHRWLGIAPDEQPAHHYRLLGLQVFEADADVIESAADRQMAHVRGFQSGEHADDAQRMLNEISAAKLVLLKADEKSSYDAQLQAELDRAEGKAARERPIAKAQPLGAAAAPPVAAPLLSDGAKPPAAGPVIHARSGKKSGAPNIVLLVGAAAVVLLLLIGGAIAMAVRPWETGPSVAVGDGDDGLPVIEPPPPLISPPRPRPPLNDDPPNNPGAQPDKPPPNQPPPNNPPPKTDDPPKLVVPIVRYDAAKHVLLICEGAERNRAVSACDKLGLEHKTGKFDIQRIDYSSVHTIFSGSNMVDYWGGRERSKPEAFAHIEKFVADGGHLMVMGAYNGRNMHHMRRFGIKTHFIHCPGFRPVPEHTDVLFAGVEDLRPANNKLQSAGNFSVSRPHVVLLDRSDGGAKPGPALVTIPYEQGRVTFTQVEPYWKGEGWLVTVLMHWIARGSPTLADDEAYSPQIAAARPSPPESQDDNPMTEPTRHPLPDSAARDAAREKIAGIFNVQDADSPEERIDLANRLLATARDSDDDPVAQFVLLNLAREAAAEAAKIRLAYQAIDLLEANFDFDVGPVRLATLGASVKASVPPEQKRESLFVGIDMIEAMIGRDDHEAAGTLVAPLIDVARRMRDKALVDQLVELRKRSIDLQAAHHDVQSAFAILKTNPDDPHANRAVGQYYLLAKGDWALAMPLLINSGDAALADAARLELKTPGDTEEQEQLADAWWAIAEAERDEPAQRVIQARAMAWYQRAAPNLTGLAKLKAERRVKQLADAGIRPADLTLRNVAAPPMSE